jgi:hypothetical protein
VFALERDFNATPKRQKGCAELFETAGCIKSYADNSFRANPQSNEGAAGGMGLAMSKQAFSKAMQNIDPELFRYLLRTATVEPCMEPDVAERMSKSNRQKKTSNITVQEEATPRAEPKHHTCAK